MAEVERTVAENRRVTVSGVVAALNIRNGVEHYIILEFTDSKMLTQRENAVPLFVYVSRRAAIMT